MQIKWCDQLYKCLYQAYVNNVKGVVHFKKKKLLLIFYSPPCNPRYLCHSFFSRKEIKVFDENIPGFFSFVDSAC